MMAHEMRLKASKMSRTNLATAPVLDSRSRMSPPMKSAEYGSRCIWVWKIP
jgi:hypothetical protein